MGTRRPPHRPNLIAVGASVRAFACSAARAGWAVHAADLFGDADLRAIAATTMAVGGRGEDRYPQRLVAAVAALPAAAWCYTGALENHPDVLAAIVAERPLFGSAPAAVRAVRDHARLADVARAAGLGFPDTRGTSAGVPRDGTFLVKPRASAGGRGIVAWSQEMDHPAGAAHIWQRRIAGGAWAAAYAISGDGTARLWGVSRQLVGRDWCRSRPFAYCGSLDVPLPTVPAPVREPLQRFGAALAAAFAPLGLVGLVGVDLIVDPANRPHVIEVNPRPTASMELVERRSGESLAAVHVTACGGAALAVPPARPGGSLWGKAVLFASCNVIFNESRAAAVGRACPPATDAESAWGVLADIPCSGTAVPAGAPLLTVFAEADTPAAVLDRLRRRVAAVDTVVSAGEPPGN